MSGTRAVIKFLFLQGKAPKEIHAILTETLACFLPGRAKDLSAPLQECGANSTALAFRRRIGGAFIPSLNSSVAEASTCTMKYFSEASVLYIFLTLDIRGINDIRLISNPIHAPSHELDETDTNIPPTRVVSKSIFVELLGIREESVYSIYGV